jgi:hypothetical protein
MTIDISLKEKRDLILNREKQFCHQVSSEILDKPRLGIWMILIPIFCVFYFYQLKRYSEGRKEFAENFLITRERALNNVYTAVQEGMDVDVEKVVQAGDIPEHSREEYRNWLKLLTDHYLSLIRGRGQSFEELVKSAYDSKGQYIQLTEELNRVEREFNSKLQPHLDLDNSEVREIITKIENATIRIRRRQVKEVFS